MKQRHNETVRILIVEDEPDIAEGMETALRREGYRPETARTGPEGEDKALLGSYGAILLDVMLPGKSGTEVCRTLRQCGISTPILMVTARDQVFDRVKGLDEGADDYLIKPFAIEELLARLRSITRREGSRRSNTLHVGNLTIDTAAQTVMQGGTLVHLTQREFSLLEALAQNEGRVLSRDTILDRVWNTEEALPNTVNFHMKSLRRKVDPDGKLIHTVHGFGYRLQLETEN